MGRPIVYCDICGKLLREDDFAKGRAHEVDHRNFCTACRPLPVPPPAAPTPSPPGGFKKISSARLPAASPRPASKSSNPAIPPAPPPPSRTGLYLGAGGGALAVLAVIVAVASSGGKPRGEEAELRMKAATRPDAPAPATTARAETSREPLLRAVAFRRMNPNDLAGQLRELEAALRALAGTAHEEDTKKELAAVHARIRNELQEVEKQAAPYGAAEEFGKAFNLLEAARRRYDQIDWVRGLDPLVARHRAGLDAARAEVRAKAEAARQKKDEAELAKLQARVARWELPEESTSLAASFKLEGPAPPPPPPPPPPPDAPAVAAAPKAVDVLAHAAARDFEAAIAAAKEDAELVREARAAAVEGAGQLLRAFKGKKVLVEYRDAAGKPAKIDDLLLRADATRLEMKLGAESVVIPIGEVAARTLATAYRSRPGAKPEDARGAAALCWLEGEAVEGAPALPERLKGGPPPEDVDARRAFYEAETLYFEAGRTADAQAKYRALLEEQGGTAFVRRNKAAIQARLEVPKEFVFLPEELVPSGGFKLMPNKRVERCWTSEKDVEGPDAKRNFMEVSFPATPDRPLRGFVYVGGCCAETFAFHLQGSEMRTPDGKGSAEPGGDAALLAKHTITGLKKRHQDHLGPKEPDRWEWVTLILPKYGEAGPKTLRLLSDQKGFSVALLVVSADRLTPPRDLDPKEVERRRAEVPGYLSRGGVQLGSLWREIWRGIPNGGIGDLTNHPNFAKPPTEAGPIPSFEIVQDSGDEYGTRVRGYVHAPSTGEYVFWISTDDQGELWLSTDDDPRNKALIARVPEWTPPRVYDKHAEQKSKPVRLEAGRRYYVEALHKEGIGGDHLSVRWQLPDGAMEAPIPGTRLSPWTGGKR